MASSVNKIGAVNTSSSDGDDGTRAGKVRMRPRCRFETPSVSLRSSNVGEKLTEDVVGGLR